MWERQAYGYAMSNQESLYFLVGSKLWHAIAECQSLQGTAANKDVGGWLSLSYLFSVAGAVVGASVVAGTGVLVEASGAAVVAGSSALLQPAKNVKAIKAAVAVNNLLFIIVFYLSIKLIYSIFFKKYQVGLMLTQELRLLTIKQPLLSGAGLVYVSG